MVMQTQQTTPKVAVLELSGRFDAYEVPSVIAWLEKSITTAPARVVVNLAGVKFIDSSALAALVKGMKDCRQHRGDLHLCSMQQPVRIIFELTRLDRAFNIYDSLEEAVKGFGN